MFYIMKQRKGPHGRKQWMAINDEEFFGPDREPLDAKAWSETQMDPIFEFAVFEKLESPAPPSE